MQFENATKKVAHASNSHAQRIEKNGAITTGDIDDSTKLSMAERSIMLDAIGNIQELLSPAIDIKMEIRTLLPTGLFNSTQKKGAKSKCLSHP